MPSITRYIEILSNITHTHTDQPFSYPPSRNTHYAIHQQQQHYHHRGDIRDTRARITAGLDHSLIQAVSQMQDGNHTPSAASVASSSGSRRSHRRRSGRRRRQYSNPNPHLMTYHHPNRSRHRDEYSRHHSEGDNAYYSTSDHENYHPAARSCDTKWTRPPSSLPSRVH